MTDVFGGGLGGVGFPARVTITKPTTTTAAMTTARVRLRLPSSYTKDATAIASNPLRERERIASPPRDERTPSCAHGDHRPRIQRSQLALTKGYMRPRNRP